MLVKIKCSVPIGFDLKKCSWGEYNKEKVVQILKNWGFYSLIKRLPNSGNDKTEKIKDEIIKNNLSLW